MDRRIVGREVELAAAADWLASAVAGTGRLVLCVGEPGIGKTRFAEEIFARASTNGMRSTWGSCLELEGAPPYWLWRQVLTGVGVDAGPVLAGPASPEDRYRLMDDLTEALLAATPEAGLIVVLDDVHAADDGSLLCLRHLTHRLAEARVLVVATARDSEPGSVLPTHLPDLLRSRGTTYVELRRFGLAEVAEQLAGLMPHSAGRAGEVLDVTAGNPLFVREVARAMAEGSWAGDRPPRTVLDLVSSRLGRLSPEGRRLAQVAAVVGRDFSLELVARAAGIGLAECVDLADEVVALGLVERSEGRWRFVHALTRDAVEAALPSAERLALHRSVAEAIEKVHAEDLGSHLGELARHWAELASYGEAAVARGWAARAADDAVRRLAFEQGIRWYRAALAMGPLPDDERGRLCLVLARAQSLAGDLYGCADTAQAAAEVAERTGDDVLLGEAALLVAAAPDVRVNAVAAGLGERALAVVGDEYPALRARLLAQRVHLAYYEGTSEDQMSLARDALELARVSGDDGALVEALHAGQEANPPGPADRTRRLALADELLELARRTDRQPDAMWAHLWRIEAHFEGGDLAGAEAEVTALRPTVAQVGGPGSAALLARVSAAVALARGRYPDAVAAAARAFDRMHAVEPGAAFGARLLFHCALARHRGVAADVEGLLDPIPGPPAFAVLQDVHRAWLLLRSGRRSDAESLFDELSPPATWSAVATFRPAVDVYGALIATELGRLDDLDVLVRRLSPLTGYHAHGGNAVTYLGPVDLVLGRAALALGRTEDAVRLLDAAATQAERAGARPFVAEARRWLAEARTTGSGTGPLTERETEVAVLVAEGLTNGQIGERLFISERTVQNHVQHILRKLDFATRSQIAAWSARSGLHAPRPQDG